MKQAMYVHHRPQVKNRHKLLPALLSYHQRETMHLYHLTLKMKALQSTDSSINVHPVTQHHTPEYCNLQQHCCETLQSHTARLF